LAKPTRIVGYISPAEMRHFVCICHIPHVLSFIKYYWTVAESLYLGEKLPPMLVNGDVHIIRLHCYLFHAVTRFEIMKEKMQQKLTSGIMKFLTL